MKNLFGGVFLLSVIIGLFAFRNAKRSVTDVFDLLGVDKSLANSTIQDNLFYASLNVPFSSIDYKKIPPSQRVVIVKELGDYMRQYFKSNEVLMAYRRFRNERMPGKQESIDVKERVEEIKRSIQQTEEDKRSAPADMKSLYDKAIEKMQDELRILQDPAHPEYRLYTGVVELTKEQQEEVNRQRGLFDKEYPADVQQYLKIKLKEFLANTSDIDFNAKLVFRDGRFLFENPEYEAKDHNWKKCFRAGRETIEAARAFAKQWLIEMERKE